MYVLMHIKYLVLQQFYRVTMLMAVAAPPFTAPVTKAVQSLRGRRWYCYIILICMPLWCG